MLRPFLRAVFLVAFALHGSSCPERREVAPPSAVGGPRDGAPRDPHASRKQVVSEFGAAGFRLVERHDFLPWQHLLVFAVGRD